MAGKHPDAFFFGTEERRLYGCFHVAPNELERDAVAVMVPPIGQEHIRCYRTLRVLADRLAMAGLNCLRFDLFGCGQSAGEDCECDIGASLQSIREAISEARRRAMADRVALIGVRLGASLASLYGAQIEPLEWLVLWDPVVRGVLHLEELAVAHERLTRRPALLPKLQHGAGCELLGFHFSGSLIRELTALDLTSLAGAPAKRGLLVESDQFNDAAPLVDAFARHNMPLERRFIRGPAVWNREGLGVFTASDIIEAIDCWLGDVTA